MAALVASPADAGTKALLSLRAQRDELAERVQQLEAVLFDGYWTPEHWNLTGQEATFLNVLALRQHASKSALLAALYPRDADQPETDKILSVLALRLRRKLAPHGVVIETVWGDGYRLDAATRIWLCQLWKAAT